MSKVIDKYSWDLARKWPFGNLVQGFKLKARYESWERDECKYKGDVKATESGGYKKGWCDVPALVVIFQSRNWQSLDGPGAWGAPQDLLHSCFKQLFLTPLTNMFTAKSTEEMIPTAGCQAVRGANCQTVELFRGWPRLWQKSPLQSFLKKVQR